MILSIILLILAILFLILTIFYEMNEGLTFFILFFMLSIIPPGLSYYSNLYDVVSLKNIDYKIKNAEQAKSQIEKNLERASSGSNAFFNADSPYKTLYETYVSIENSVLELKQKKVDLISSIERSEKGLYGYFARMVEKE